MISQTASGAVVQPAATENPPADVADATGTAEATGEAEANGEAEATGEAEANGAAEATGEAEANGAAGRGAASDRPTSNYDRRLGWLALLLGVAASLVLVGDAAAERFSPLAGGFAGLLVAIGLVVLARARFQGKAPSAAASWLTAIAAGGWIGTRCHDLVLLQFASGHTEVLDQQWHIGLLQTVMVVLVLGLAGLRRPNSFWLALLVAATPFAVAAAFTVRHPELISESSFEFLRSSVEAAAWLAAALVVVAVRAHRSLLGGGPGAVGNYVLGDVLGRGGMGVVYRARHTALDRPAAVKLVSAGVLASDGSTGAESGESRFEREARATAALRSPHTVELYDYGRAADGRLYYAMEYLEGLDLEQLVERFGPQPVGRTVHVLTQVCESLQEAHTRGVVHRDIKASNIFLCQLGSSYDFVKVLDFGLVRPSLSGRDAARAIGTPAYMAPEIAVEGAAVDGRADIYSLGCVAYWMLTGTEVFPGDDPVGVVAAHIGSEPAPPSQRTEVEIPESVDRLILRCLAKKPEDRFPDAEGLAEALQRCVCEGAWGPEQAREWWRLHAPDDGADLDVASRL